MLPCVFTWHRRWQLFRSRSQLIYCSANAWDFLRKVINSIISMLWAEPKFKTVFGTSTLWMTKGGHLVMLIMFSSQLVNCWGNKSNPNVMWLTFWFYKCTSAGDSRGEGALKIQTPCQTFSPVCCGFVLPLHPPPQQRPWTLASKCVNKHWLVFFEIHMLFLSGADA